MSSMPINTPGPESEETKLSMLCDALVMPILVVLRAPTAYSSAWDA